MISIHELESAYPSLTGDLLEVMLEIHNLVSKVAPDAVEEVRRYGVVYYDDRRGGPVRSGICQTLVQSDHIRLAFIHGSFLPDPHHLLEGDRLAKRFVRIYSFNAAPWEQLEALIRYHNRFDPMTQSFLPEDDK